MIIYILEACGSPITQFLLLPKFLALVIQQSRDYELLFVFRSIYEEEGNVYIPIYKPLDILSILSKYLLLPSNILRHLHISKKKLTLHFFLNLLIVFKNIKNCIFFPLENLPSNDFKFLKNPKHGRSLDSSVPSQPDIQLKIWVRVPHNLISKVFNALKDVFIPDKQDHGVIQDSSWECMEGGRWEDIPSCQN